ncbi:MAG: hypothetical protein ABI718_11275 [Acidobacteriota bacterium]
MNQKLTATRKSATQAVSHLFLSSFLVLALVWSTPTAQAGSAGQMRISVQVIGRAIVAIESGPSAIEISAADIKRGYAELPAPIVVRVRTNSQKGCVIEFAQTGAAFQGIELISSGDGINDAGKGSLVRSYVPGGESVAVRARLMLTPGTQVGSYPLHFEVSATAL